MGADRGILVKTDELVEPLAVAKILKAVVEAEQPGLVIIGKQAIDDDANQTGQMLAALLGWAPGHLRLQGRDRWRQRQDHPRSRWRPADRSNVKLPAVVTTDLRLNEPRYASLPNIMKAKKKPIDEKTPADYGVDVTPRLKVVKTEEPSGPQGRRQGQAVGRAGGQAQSRRRHLIDSKDKEQQQ